MPPKPPQRKARLPVARHLQPKMSTSTITNVVDLADRGPAYGVVETTDSLLVRFRPSSSTSDVQEVNLAGFLGRRELALSYAEYLATWGASATSATRAGAPGKMRSFFAFLDERQSAGHPSVDSLAEITTELVNDYQSWQRRREG